MSTLKHLYRESLSLLTDLYQLTMAYGYWKSGSHSKEAAFHLHFRKNPFGNGFTIAAGLEPAIQFLESFRFAAEEIDYLGDLTGNDGHPLFESAFLKYLQNTQFSCDIEAVPEGTVVFPHEPLLRVTGPIIQCQILETPLLNMINFQTLIATKAARVCLAARDDAVLEFGLRRAHGIDGALGASRAAYIGGCSATSNLLAGKLYGIPVRGTHAHSWVMSFDSEPDAFEAYAEAMPNNCVFLVDTYDTLEGVRNAIEVGHKLRRRGHQLVGIRLDSGDLAYLSIEARKLLDEAGFSDTFISASNELDEQVIDSLKQQGARIAVWGVGTRLVTGFDEPALGGVYKLTAVRKPGEPWQHKVKLSEQALKISNPGIQQIRRYGSSSEYIADMVYNEEDTLPLSPTLIDPADMTRRKNIPAGTEHQDLLEPIFRQGRRIYQLPHLDDVRERRRRQLTMFHEGVKRFVNPHQYPVGLEQQLFDLKTQLVLAARGVE